MTKSIDVVPTWYWPDGVPRYVSPPRSTVYKAAVERWARRTPQSPALRHGDTVVSFTELDGRLRLVATRIHVAAKTPDGDLRVAVTTGTDIDTVLALLGAVYAGADTLVLDPGTEHEDRQRLLRQFRPGLVVGHRDDASSVPGTTLEHLARPPDSRDVHDEGPDRSPAARVTLRWGDALVSHPNETLLGWAMAFRAIASLEKHDEISVRHSLACWEAVVGLLAPLVVGGAAIVPHGSVEDAVRAADAGELAGVWITPEEARALLSGRGFRAEPRTASGWVYVSVDAPMQVRSRRRLSRVLGRSVLTAFGTPATGPVAASPRAWFIEEAVGIPMPGVDLVPVDAIGGHVAEPVWPLLAFANVGVMSSFLSPPTSLRGTAPGRFVESDVLDTGRAGRIDANGFLYLV